MDPFVIKLLGFAAATCTTAAYAPQFIKVWKTRSARDISLGMFLVMVLHGRRRLAAPARLVDVAPAPHDQPGEPGARIPQQHA